MSSHLMTRHGKAAGATTPMDTPDRKWVQDIQDVLTDEGGTAAISRGRVTGDTGNEDGNVGALRAPVCLEEPPGSGYHAVPLQYIQEPGHVQGVIRLVQVQEDQVQDLLHQGR